MPANNPLKILNRAKKMLYGEEGYQYGNPDDRTRELLTTALISYCNNSQYTYDINLIYKILSQYKSTKTSHDKLTQIYNMFKKEISSNKKLDNNVLQDICRTLIEAEQLNLNITEEKAIFNQYLNSEYLSIADSKTIANFKLKNNIK